MLAILFVAILVFVELKYVRIGAGESRIVESPSEVVKEAA